MAEDAGKIHPQVYASIWTTVLVQSTATESDEWSSSEREFNAPWKSENTTTFEDV